MSPIFVANPSEIRSKIEPDMMKYCIVLVVHEYIGMLLRNNDGILRWGILRPYGSQKNWPITSDHTNLIEFIQYTWRYNSDMKLMVLKSPDDVTWFINDRRIISTDFQKLLKSAFITEKSIIPSNHRTSESGDLAALEA